MTLYRRKLSLVGAAVMLASCNSPSDPGGGPPREITALPRALAAAEQEVISASNAFAFGLLREVNGSWTDRNVFLSPLSASMALGMTMNGAAGTTFDEMRATLGFGTRPLAEIDQGYQSLIALLRGLDPQVNFQLANAIWYRQGMASALETEFLGDTRSYFDAEVGPLDMTSPQAANTVNDWAKRSTGGRIEKVLDAISDDIVMLLANAIYFKGYWREQFEKSTTRAEPFRAPGGTHDVPTMQREGTIRYARIPDAEVVDLPYGGGAYSMTILLPEQGVDVNAFVSQLTQASWQEATAGLHTSNAEIHLPRFTLKWDDTLNTPLKSLGMPQAFRAGEADFTRMSKSSGHDLFISFVRQSTFVDVNEEGTEAAAVTIVGVGITSMPAKVVVLVNRPFVFAIRENLSGTIIFLGKIIDPGAS